MGFNNYLLQFEVDLRVCDNTIAVLVKWDRSSGSS